MREVSDIRVAVLTSYKVYPAAMGGQKAISKLYSYLGNQIPVTLLLTKSNTEPENFAGNYHKLLSEKKSRYANIFLVKKIKRIIEEEKITHLILEHPYFGWLGVWLQRTTKVKLIIRSHNIESLRFKSFGKAWWRVLWYYERWTHRHADLSLFITEDDLQYALQNFGLKESKAQILTYGTDTSSTPTAEDFSEARIFVESMHGSIKPNDLLLLFNGSLSYGPNVSAIKFILDTLLPNLKKLEFQNFKILICGKGLSATLEQRITAEQQVIYAGFVPEIEPYFLAADIFINPVNEGGGIKTKLVEALAYGLTSISTSNGALGIPRELVGEKLIIAETSGNDMSTALKAINLPTVKSVTPSAFYEHFSWKNITQKLVLYLKEI